VPLARDLRPVYTAAAESAAVAALDSRAWVAKRSTDLVPNLVARRLPNGGRARLRHPRSATIKV
jgi:hypothetical protein